jgi:hypothetical protein
MFNYICYFKVYLHTPQVPPSFEQYLQYLQFLQALQFFEPVHLRPFVYALTLKPSATSATSITKATIFFFITSFN